MGHNNDDKSCKIEGGFEVHGRKRVGESIECSGFVLFFLSPAFSREGDGDW
jgi:hypothetical protein